MHTLYSFRRCPYAMRARMALAILGEPIEVREILLRQKPAAFLQLSAKGTVPVLEFDDGGVLEESLDIMQWALSREGSGWIDQRSVDEQRSMAERFDSDFKPLLDAYKYHHGNAPRSPEAYRDDACAILRLLELRLAQERYLLGPAPQFYDLALMPFIRQFAAVDRPWFDQAPLPCLRAWLDAWLEHSLFISVMPKFPLWEEGRPGATWSPDIN